MYYSIIEVCNFSSGHVVESTDYDEDRKSTAKSIGEASTAMECAKKAKKEKMYAIGATWSPEGRCWAHFGAGATLVKTRAGAEKRKGCLFEKGIEI